MVDYSQALIKASKIQYLRIPDDDLRGTVAVVEIGVGIEGFANLDVQII